MKDINSELRKILKEEELKTDLLFQKNISQRYGFIFIW